MHILIAPNAFKNSLTAQEAAIAIRKGLRKSNLSCTYECFPVGDGGDGTAGLIVEQCGGILVKLEVNDPLGRKIQSSFGLIDNGQTAVIEMADASGLRLLNIDELDPLRTSTFGTGETIKSALEKGVRKIILCMGGSATVDGGCGILRALGIRFLDIDGKELQAMPGSLVDLFSIDVSMLDQRVLAVELSVLCDVDNILLGEAGAAKIFGPQKGATGEDVKRLEAALTRFNEVTRDQFEKNMAGVKYGGTAGGAAAGLYAFLNAELVNGIDHYLELTNFDDALKRSDIVITGEGSIDEQTLQGKGPYGVAYKAKAKKIPVIGLAGKIPVKTNAALEAFFDVLLAIGNEPTDLNTALKQTTHNLIRTAATIGNMLNIQIHNSNDRDKT